MIKNKKVLAIIPARGGSKGIPRKNMIPLCGKPLLAYSIEAAQKSNYIDRILVSTDSAEIAQTAELYGVLVPTLRPQCLAEDDTRTIDVMLYHREELEKKGQSYDIVVLLQPTQPLRTAADVDAAIELFEKKGSIGVVSISEADDHPILMRVMAEGRMEKLVSEASTVRRQEFSKVYKVNGCIYVNAMQTLRPDTSLNDNPIPFMMEKSHAVDIDEYIDLAVAECYIKQQEGQRLFTPTARRWIDNDVSK